MRYIFVAGTFNVFHDGHKRLLDKALEVQRENDGSAIIVGVTTDEYARTHKDVPVNDFWIRAWEVEKHLRSKGCPFSKIWPIDGPGIPWFMLHPCPNCGSTRIDLDWDGDTYCPRCKDCGFDSIWVADCEECAIMAWIDMTEIYEREEEDQWH